MQDWIKLNLAEPLHEGGVVVATTSDGKTYAACLVGGQTYVCDNRCRHQGGPLAAGYLSGTGLTCRWHGWEYDIVDGSCVGQPDMPIQVYESRLEGGTVYIRRPEQ